MKFRLKDFRQSKRLFQSDMAGVMGTNQSTVSRMELRPVAEISHPQYVALCERFGQEEVDAYIVPLEEAVAIVGNTNTGSGTQNYQVTSSGDVAMEIIREQTRALTESLRKQAEQMDRLLTLMERIPWQER